MENFAALIGLAQAADLNRAHSDTATDPAGGKSGSGPPPSAATMREQSG